jgi:4a-hydroxytetrahydrobiopterin dehydratase
MLPLGEISRRLESLKDWALEGDIIVKDFSFKDFKEALEFVNMVGLESEKQEHHPDITISYNKVRLSLRTHEENGLTSKDFELAEEIDKI